MQKLSTFLEKPILSFSTPTMIRTTISGLLLVFLWGQSLIGLSQTPPSEINFVRQGVKRMIFDADHAIPLASFRPDKIIGMRAMHPLHPYTENQPTLTIEEDQLIVHSSQTTESSVWLGGMNPFATYVLEIDSYQGTGEMGFEFADAARQERLIVSLSFQHDKLRDARIRIHKADQVVLDESVLTAQLDSNWTSGRLILQLFGSGLNLFVQQTGLPIVIGQHEFNSYLDLREKQTIQTFHSSLYLKLQEGIVTIGGARSELSTGLGQADIRAITYKDGSPFIDQGRLWYTLSIRGRALPHHIQGVFSMSPSVFDIRMEGVIVFDRGDGLLRNEISTHIFYDPETELWRGLTTGFTAYANPATEQKQILAIESKQDPRFGFSVMEARPMGIVGDIEDSHILFDEEVQKWRLLTCENLDGYKAVMMESNNWDRDYTRIAGPVSANSTGTSIQQIGDTRYCFSGSSERKVFIYSYPDLAPAGTLKMDLPPWDETSRTRIWPNVLTLPEGYPNRYVGLMMDRFNYPGLTGPNWTYGALYLYYGHEE